MQDLRKEFINVLMELADKDKNVVFLVGDVGYSFADPFIKKFPEQFINTGVMEQSMTGIAAGMAIAGKKPYIYSMIPFLTMRNYEQVRDDIAYQNRNVKIIGVQGSERYKFLGFTHNAYNNEDMHILRVLPNLEIYDPLEERDLREIMYRTYDSRKPTYISL